MRKICILLCLLLFSCPYFVSCEFAIGRLNPEFYVTNEVVKAELVYFKNDTLEYIKEEIWDFDNPDPILDDICFENATFIVELNQEQIPELTERLTNLTYEHSNTSVKSPVGYTLLLHLKTEDIIVVSSTKVNDRIYSIFSRYTSDGKFIEHLGCLADIDGYNDILSHFFGIEIES